MVSGGGGLREVAVASSKHGRVMAVTSRRDGSLLKARQAASSSRWWVEVVRRESSR
jgi:hypothetical protein